MIQSVGFIGVGFGLVILINRLTQFLNLINLHRRLITKLDLQKFQFEVVKVDTQGNITNRQKRQVKYFVEDMGNGVSLEMVQIPAGTFTMGSPRSIVQNEPNDVKEEPQHQVTIPEFFMSKYEVTQSQYQAIMGNNPSVFRGENRPVENVTWNDAVEFCKRLSRKTGKNYYRLPSEAEWEYACRAETTTPFYFGETVTPDLANCYGEIFQTVPVGRFPPNAFGLYDMHGNVWEWCQDYLHYDYQGSPTNGSAWLTGENSLRRILRGGFWEIAPGNCRSGLRNQSPLILKKESFGIRVVYSLS